MPADTKAKYYTWYMTAEPTQRLVAYEWWPEGGVIGSSMTYGRLIFKFRSEPDDIWDPGVEISSVPWVVAQNMARNEGFHIEEPVFERS